MGTGLGCGTPAAAVLVGAGRAGHPVLLRGDAGSLPRWAPGLILEVAWAIFFLFFQSILFTIIHITIFVNVPMATALTAYIEM